MSPLAERIKEVIEEFTILQHADNRRIELKQKLIAQSQQWKEMDAQLAKELNDIEKLEKLSITALFHKVLGSKEEQLEKERQEYLELNLQFKDLNKAIEITEYELGILEKKVGKKDLLERELESLKKSREAEILRNNEAQKIPLLDKINKIDEQHKYQIELNQAKEAATACLNNVKQALAHLQKAIEWGQWDMTRSGNMGEYQKRSAIDRAIQYSQQANHHLQILQGELADVGYQSNISRIDFPQMQSFVSILFDNLISDWIIQQKIKNTLHHVDAVHDKLVLILQTLDNDIKKSSQLIAQLTEERNQILIS